MPYSLKGIFSQDTAKGARSTALHSLQWALGLLLGGLTTTLLARGPEWLTIMIAACIFAVLLVFLGAYCYLIVKNPDALRSEQFYLSKMAIEKGLIGDSNAGFVEADVIEPARRVAITSDLDPRE